MPINNPKLPPKTGYIEIVYGLDPVYKRISDGELFYSDMTPVFKLLPSKNREEAYNTQSIIEWDGSMLTVTEASQKWQYYAAEGNTAKTDALTALIAAAKQTIREQYPDEEGGA